MKERLMAMYLDEMTIQSQAGPVMSFSQHEDPRNDVSKKGSKSISRMSFDRSHRMRVYRWFALLIAFAAVSGLSAADIGVTMSMPNDLNANPGGIVTVPINLSGVQASFSLDAFQLIVEYDNAFFETPLATGFKLGTLTSGRDYTGLDSVTAASKSFSILRSATSNPASLTTSSTGSLMTFEIQVRASVAPGSDGYLAWIIQPRPCFGFEPG
jgi:hypothetical protein